MLLKILPCLTRYWTVWVLSPHGVQHETGSKHTSVPKELFLDWEPPESTNPHQWHPWIDGTDIWRVEEADGLGEEIRREERGSNWDSCAAPGTSSRITNPPPPLSSP